MTADPKSPGQKLKEAREALGKSTSELAEQTRITVQQLEGLESDDYSSIPAPMYVRGFLKLYATELGLDPAPLLEAYKRSGQGGHPERKLTRLPADPLQESPRSEPPPPSPSPNRKRPIFASQTPLEAPGRDPDDDTPPAWKAWMETLVEHLIDPEWWKSSWTPRIAAGIVILLVLVSTLSRLGSRQSDEPETAQESAPPAPREKAELPELAQPYLRAPSPLYFELPRTLE